MTTSITKSMWDVDRLKLPCGRSWWHRGLLRSSIDQARRDIYRKWRGFAAALNESKEDHVFDFDRRPSKVRDLQYRSLRW